MYHLAKALGQFVYPFNLAIVCLVACLWCLRKGRTRWSAGLVVAAILLLAVPGLPIVSDALLWNLETSYPAMPAAEYPAADAIVVLGGSTRPVLAPRREPEDGGSRLLAAARLYAARRAPLIVVSGGGPYESADGAERTEADDMRDILLAMKVPAGALVTEEASRNTLENAQNTAELLKKRKVRSVLLVTSAFHLPRAAAAFSGRQLKVTPVPCGHLVGESRIGLWRFLPNASSLNASSTAIREHVGAAVQSVLR